MSGTITHPSEHQLGFFGFTSDGSLVVTVQEEPTRPGIYGPAPTFECTSHAFPSSSQNGHGSS